MRDVLCKASAKILVIDDEPDNLNILECYLQDAGYTNLTLTSNSREAINLYGEQDFDLVLLDIMMPEPDGFSVMKQLELFHPEQKVPVLVITARQDRETRIKALRMGARDFLLKPFDEEEVLIRISNLLEMRLGQKKLETDIANQVRELNSRKEQIFQNQLEIMKRLGMAAEHRDNETGLHVERMSSYSRLIALSIGMGEYEADLLFYTAPMHDVGKIGVPDSILLKSGKLTTSEMEIMKRHSEIGANMLDNHESKLLRTGRIIALTHHEKWDGSGYPNSLSGEDIPLFGRIAALADVFDALTSERPYKKAWMISDALEYISSQSEKHFDPLLVKSFLGIVPGIVEIKQRFQEGNGYE